MPNPQAAAQRPPARICLNMIVKNEIGSIERCLLSVAPFISCWVIGDTGSTDGTQDAITGFFAARGIPGELHMFPFHDFGQARNQALDLAYASPLGFDYLLFNDADMELVVEDPDVLRGLHLPGYMLQIRCGFSYWLTRLVRRDAGLRYRGVTHESMDLTGEIGRLTGAWIRDHATGSNRAEKFTRDIRLLTQGLAAEPDNARYQFYLAESLLNAGRPAEAEAAYAKRIAMGGWEEEAWYACLQRARCFWHLNDEANFLRAALAAHDRRPQRAEPLYDLARFHRQRGMYETSLLFAAAGLKLAPPHEDVLFLEDAIYRFGLVEEFSIAANYARDPATKARGFAACDWLALNPALPPETRALARRNLHFYAGPAIGLMASFAWVAGEGPPRAGDAADEPALDPAALAPLAADGLCACGPLAPWEGGWLGLVREAAAPAGDGAHGRIHRLVWLDAWRRAARISFPFFLPAPAPAEARRRPADAAPGHVMLGCTDSAGGQAVATIAGDDVTRALRPVATYTAARFSP